MRMRKKKHTAERLAACSDLLLPAGPVEFGDPSRPLYLEIGCGKGAFLMQNALRFPDIRYIGLERVSDVILAAMERLHALEPVPQNVRFLNVSAERLPEFFPPHSVDRIYLNFSDPWPKAGHQKRRLTHPDYLARYRTVLRENGAVFMKTDNRPLFEYSLAQFAACGFEMDCVTYDLHHSEWNEGNIMTEYETLFSMQGIPICRVEARPV